ncbi:MAG: STAS/SEC14 domain-containing protein [Verrucomicrobiia bacterium]
MNDHEQHFTIDLTKKQIEDSPSLNSDKPVSHQFEQAYYGYYGLPMYWRGEHALGDYSYLVRDREKWKTSTQGKNRGITIAMGTGTELKFESKHLADIERLAMVGDMNWQMAMTMFCKPFMKATIHYFDHGRAAAARQWLAES